MIECATTRGTPISQSSPARRVECRGSDYPRRGSQSTAADRRRAALRGYRQAPHTRKICGESAARCLGLRGTYHWQPAKGRGPPGPRTRRALQRPAGPGGDEIISQLGEGNCGTHLRICPWTSPSQLASLLPKIIAEELGIDENDPCFLSSLRMSLSAARLSRRRCTSMSRISPSGSTARQRYIRLPVSRTTIYQDAIGHSGAGAVSGAFVPPSLQTSAPSGGPFHRKPRAHARQADPPRRGSSG